MTSPSMVHRSGDTLVVRSVVSGNQLYTNGDPEDSIEDIDYCDEFFDDLEDNKNLPECKIRRNYSCVSCHYFTQNPRHYLYHLRDVHNENVRIYECPYCLYASKHFQKLLRHSKMVHASLDTTQLMETQRLKFRKKRKRASNEDTSANQVTDEEINQEEDNIQSDESSSSKQSSDLKCSLCSFTTKHQGQLTKHERQEHIKTKFFRCTKCSYVTHIKARFTKHVKYHSMPMIKCDLCDFRTPYKWNLDRHYKNHNGHGAFRCSACNFTADIKQSLTVHEMNHHVPPVGQAAGLGVGRRRNKVGASDTTAAEEAALIAAQTSSGLDISSGHIEAGNIQKDVAQIGFDEKQESSFEIIRKNPKIKVSIKKLKTSLTNQEQNERHNFENDFIHPDDIIHHSNGNIYIKNKCKLCNFKTAWDSEMAKHERNVHKIFPENLTVTSNNLPIKKTPRPIPNLIPIQSTIPGQTISPNSLLKVPMLQPRHLGNYQKQDETESILSQKDLNDMCAKSVNSALRDFASLFGEETTISSTQNSINNEKQDDSSSVPVQTSSIFKKKNASFFDKLKEKLMTDESCNLICKWCGHESKCLSESAKHKKTCGKQIINNNNVQNISSNVTNSTRCQFCRQRCKSSIDLHNHLQICSEANKQLDNIDDTFHYKFEKPDITIKLEEEPCISENSNEPHPMENVVFVWNNISPLPEFDQERSDSRMDDNQSLDLSIRVKTPESEASSFIEPENLSTNSTPAKMPTHGNDIDLVTEGRRVFKCPHCSFWATTASRFHVHIVGHLNKKPFECSLCAYRSNWRWDITKHIRLKSVRDPAHEKARVLMTDETGRRNYSKYNKYLTQLRSNDASSQDSNSAARKAKMYEASQGNLPNDNGKTSVMELPKLTRAPSGNDLQNSIKNPLRPPPPLKAANDLYFQSYNEHKKRRISSDSKKTTYKCKKCNFRDASRETILQHVKSHYRQDGSASSDVIANTCAIGNAENDEASVSRGQAPFRCGHCHQVSNWKHVIQRHCRLKHRGDVRVVIGSKNGTTEKIEVDDQTDEPDQIMEVEQNGIFKCKQCPYSTDLQQEFELHLDNHNPKSEPCMKCYFCPYFIVEKLELFEHLKLHGVENPEEYVMRAMQGRDLVSPINNQDGVTNFKRYKCFYCPYVSNSKSQFLYHKQFHRYRGGRFKCDFCSYNVTKRHLLHQHMKVHGVTLPTIKNRNDSDHESDLEDFEEILTSPDEGNVMDDQHIYLDVPLVWFSRDGKFSKMYKCRFCPHVNLRKVNIQEHEKMHSLRERNPNSPRSNDQEHHCNECSYICNNAGVLSSHLKVHQTDYGQIHCLVDTSKSDDEQISELTRLLNLAQRNNSDSSDIEIKDEFHSDDQENNLYESDKSDRILYFCQQCPARFLREKEFIIHNRFHGVRLFYRCEFCSYAAREKLYLLSHNKVHCDEYQEKTKTYLSEYPVHHNHPQPKTAVLMDAFNESNGPIWIVISSENETKIVEQKTSSTSKHNNKNFACKKCPARFFKNDLLKYHMTLHGCNNPYKCRYCDYAARTSSNLQKHVRIHDEEQPVMTKIMPKIVTSTTTVVPISGTDLFQQKSEAQAHLENQQTVEHTLSQIPLHIDPQFGTLVNGNPKFIYPTYVKNGRMKEKRYKCHKCPSAFEKREQYKVHVSLHGSQQKYKCQNCDYSVKYYANYIQHIKKHQINDNVRTKSTENEDDINDPPFSKLAIKSLNVNNSKRGPLKLSVADRQTLMILQQRRTSNASSTKESSTEDKKLFWCSYCPYTSYRKDAVDNHINRHIQVSGLQSNYTCEHCDYTVPQSHFLREHVKIHFTPQKNYQPEGFMHCDNLQLITKTISSDDDSCNSDGNQIESVIFEDSGDTDSFRFKPKLDTDVLTNNNNNNNEETKIYVNPENGEFLENSSVLKLDTKEQKKSH